MAHLIDIGHGRFLNLDHVVAASTYEATKHYVGPNGERVPTDYDETELAGIYHPDDLTPVTEPWLTVTLSTTEQDENGCHRAETQRFVGAMATAVTRALASARRERLALALHAALIAGNADTGSDSAADAALFQADELIRALDG